MGRIRVNIRVLLLHLTGAFPSWHHVEVMTLTSLFVYFYFLYSWVDQELQFKIKKILSVLPTNMDILFSREGEFTLIEFKINSHCFYGLKYRRNWWHVFRTHLLSYASCVRFHCIWKKRLTVSQSPIAYVWLHLFAKLAEQKMSIVLFSCFLWSTHKSSSRTFCTTKLELYKVSSIILI